MSGATIVVATSGADCENGAEQCDEGLGDIVVMPMAIMAVCFGFGALDGYSLPAPKESQRDRAEDARTIDAEYQRQWKREIERRSEEDASESSEDGSNDR